MAYGGAPVRARAKRGPMTFWQAIRQCIVDKYATAQGRASRAEFWCYFFAFLVFCCLWLAFIEILTIWFGDINLIDFVLLYIPFIFLPPLAAACIRRLHDLGKSGWLGLLLLLPLLNILGIGILCMPGAPGPNQYGAPPPHVEI